MLKRKIDSFLAEWKQKKDKKPLIVKGARQIGKTASIEHFAKNNYVHIVEINFALQPKFKRIFDDGFEVDIILKNISRIDPSLVFSPGETLLFFDELQDCPNCATSLKSFKLDGRYDVICSGSLMGLYYQQIESNSVGYKEDYEMYSLDFEEFLWASGYGDDFIDELYDSMINLQPLSSITFDVLSSIFRDYMIIGGMPEVVNRYAETKQFSGTLQLQQQLLRDYEEDITKYASGFDKAKVLAVYRHISTFLAQENKKFQVTKIAHGARNREYMGAVEWLANAGIVNDCYCIATLELPLKGNYDPKQYKLYYGDTGLLIASLDDEAQDDLRSNNNFGTYKGAIYENIVADMLVKQGYDLYYYNNNSPSLEMDFFVRDTNSLIPIEVKANNNATVSLNRLIDSDANKYSDIRYGIKLCNNNIGFNGKFYTFPYSLTFLLKRFLKNKK